MVWGRELAWKVLIDRAQTKVNLAQRNALPVGTSLDCALCLGGEETGSHLFFGCSIAWRVWSKIYFWLGLRSVGAAEAKSHFLQHVALINPAKKFKKTLTLIWTAAISSIWWTRNNVLFNSGVVDVERIVDAIKYKVWLWLKVKEESFTFSFFEWLGNPLICMQVL